MPRLNVRKVIETKGLVADDDITAVRQAGYSDGQIAEAIGYIGLATFSNLFNHVHDKGQHLWQDNFTSAHRKGHDAKSIPILP